MFGVHKVWNELVHGVGDAMAALSEEHVPFNQGATTLFQPDRLEKSYTVSGYAHSRRACGDDDDDHASPQSPHFSPRWSDLFHCTHQQVMMGIIGVVAPPALAARALP